MSIASAFNEITVAQGGTASKTGSIAGAIDKLNDVLAGSDQPGADTIEQAIRLLGQHIGGGSSVTVEALTATENKTYTAPSGKAYSPVTVDVSGGASYPGYFLVGVGDQLTGALDKTFAEIAEAYEDADTQILVLMGKVQGQFITMYVEDIDDTAFEVYGTSIYSSATTVTFKATGEDGYPVPVAG